MKMDHPLPIQLAALPFRFEGDELRVLLVTSRETRRWVLPKGWPMKNLKPHQAAEREALEEAGVKGRVKKTCLGEYTYFKRLSDGVVLCEVRVFPLEVREQLPRWKEMGQREQAWFAPLEAAALVDEPELASLLRDLPARLRRRGDGTPREAIP